MFYSVAISEAFAPQQQDAVLGRGTEVLKAGPSCPLDVWDPFMASKKKQKGMVFHQEGATTPAAASAADRPPARSVSPKPGEASEAGTDAGTRVTKDEVEMMSEPNMYPSKEPLRTSDGLPAVKCPASSNPQSVNLSPDSICRGIKVTLDNNSMWNEFFRCRTEMIVTQQGSRMFPSCRFRIAGLQPSRKYSLIMDIQPLDTSRYKWCGKSWQAAGKAECHVKCPPFAHPESPSTGQHWMQSPVSFYRLKLTNNMSGQDGNTILHPMHSYLPRLHIVQTDKAAKDIKLSGPSVVTFTFPQTEFMAVTSYQNSRFSQLKVDYNPFAKGLKEDGSSSWGLKLKLNSGKESSKDGGAPTKEQHPVKKSLKSLLANHKPRSSKAVDATPSGSGDLQRNATTEEEQRRSDATGECSSSDSRPAQKLFSELIREAHVSLHRCNLEQLSVNNNAPHRTNTKTNALRSNGQDVSKKDGVSLKTYGRTSPEKKGATVPTKRKVKKDKDLLNSLNCKANVRTDSCEISNVVAAPAESQNASVDSDHQPKPGTPAEVKGKQHKRPLPLPALALFLKQHSTKSKTAKSKLDSPPPAPPSEVLSESQDSAAAPSDHPSKAPGPSEDVTDNQASGHTDADLHPEGNVLNITGQAMGTIHTPPSPSGPDAVASTEPKGLGVNDLLASAPDPEPALPDGAPVLPSSDQAFCSFQTSISNMSSTVSTSSEAHFLSQPLDTVLPAPSSPHTPPITGSSTLPTDSSIRTFESLLPDPECSSFSFDPLSPASSPEPLPSLPTALTLELDSTTSEPTPKAVCSEELKLSEDSSASVFKWHTVLPPPQPYVDTSFPTFQPTTQVLPLASVTSPLSQTPDTSSSVPPHSPPPSFVENDQSLPFPAELSPLALQLPLSPTFSSLGGDGLSPSPSLADLVHFFSIDGNLGMEVEFTNTEALVVPSPSPSPVEANAHEPCQEAQPVPANTPCKRKKKSRQRKPTKTDMDHQTDASAYTVMQPSLEEVEEQLFISFTSKEALKLHTVDPDGAVSEPQTAPGAHLQQPADAPDNAETSERLEERIAVFEEILLRDLKLMRHRQVIHPVLQEVGLKMNLLDPTLVIDLQYLGVRLPIPPPGVSLEPLTQELPPPQGVSAAFVSRTGKTTDVTQIKGWREKFTPSEAPPTPTPTPTPAPAPAPAPTPPKPEAGPSSDLPKKNLSAFCSDMLDEYLENEGKLIDERASSFSQPVVEPLVYELPVRSTSYVRTLDSVLKKKTVSSPTSDLISGFIPPSKRPKLPVRDTKLTRKEKMRQKGLRLNKARAEAATGPTPAASSAESQPVPKPPAVPPSSEPAAESPKSKKHLKVRFTGTEPLTPSPEPRNRKKLKPKTTSKTLSPLKSTGTPPGVSEDMAPLESDSELGTAANQSDAGRPSCRKPGGPSVPLMTRVLLRQKDLEDGVVWAGCHRTSITEERAAIALTSLFTQTGFVSENPTAPIQLVRRRAPPCLNEFCRLGCVCSSLAHSSRVSHCGRPPCMFGCSCLKQKVVLLKNLDGSDSSPSQHGHAKKRKRKRRMKMAYVLKEADSVSQPAERVRTLWRRGDGDSDPVHAPKPAPLPRPAATPGRPGRPGRPRRPPGPPRSPGPPRAVSPAAPVCLQDRSEDSSCARVRLYQEKKKRSRKQLQMERPDPPTETSTHVKPEDSGLEPLRDLKDPETRADGDVPKDSGLKPPRDLKDPETRAAGVPVALPDDPPPTPSKRLVIVADCKWASEGDRSLVLMKLCEAMAQDRLDAAFWIQEYLISPLSRTLEGSGAECCVQYKMLISRPKPEREPRQEPVRAPAVQREEMTQQQVPVKVEPPEDWQREVEEVDEEEEAEPPEDWQREVEDDIEEEQESTDQQVHDGRESSSRDLELTKKNKRKMMASLGLPFLTGVSPTGFLSANKKQPGGTEHLVQVNGKLYPLAKIQLGKMGALHPANRLAAYLTGRVGISRKLQGSLSSASAFKAPQNQSPAPTRSSAAPGLATAAAAPPRCSPTDSAAPKGSQLLMLQVPPAPVGLPVPVQTSCSGHRMLLQPVKAASGVQVYRRPDGKLVKLVPVSQLRSVNQNHPVQRAVPAASLQTAVVPVKQTPLRTTATPGVSSLSGLQSFSVSSSSPRPSSLLAQKGACTFKILPSRSGAEPLIVTCPKVLPKVGTPPGSFAVLQPHPPTATTNAAAAATLVKLISLKPSTGRGAELGVKTVTASAVASEKPAVQTAPAPAPVPPVEPELEPEVARDLLDLDIVCVDDETALGSTETASSETDNSSDMSDDSDGEKEPIPKQDQRINNNNNKSHDRSLHNALEKERRGKLRQLFEGLRREVGLTEEKSSKILTLTQAVQEIQRLSSADALLQKKKRRLTERRNQFLAIIAPTTEEISVTRHGSADQPERQGSGRRHGDAREAESSEETASASEDEKLVTKTTNFITVTNAEDAVQSVAVETLKERVRLNGAQRRLARIMRNVDSESGLSVKRLLAAQSASDATNATNATHATNANDATQSPERRLLQAHQEIQTLETETHRLKSLKICLSEQRDAFIREICRRSGKSEQRIRRKLQHHLSSNQRRTKKERHRTANQGGGASDPAAGDSTDDDVISSSYLQQQTSQAPPTPASSPPAATPVPTPALSPVLSPVQPRGAPAPPGVSHTAPAVRDRPRTVPNILSRRKSPAASQSVQVLPAEVLSVVGASLPGQPVLTLSQLMTSPAVLQTPPPGVASVTLNIPSLTNQHIHLTSLPRPPTAADINNLLQLVQPSTTQQQQQQTQPQQQTQQQQQQTQQQQTLQQQTQQQQQQQQTQQQQHTQQQQQQTQQQQTQQQTQQQQRTQQQQTPPLQQEVPAGLVLSSDLPLRRADVTAAPPSAQSPSYPPLGAEPVRAGPLGAGPLEPVRASETRDDESLTSLLNEIVFLNQTTTASAVPSPGQPSCEDAVVGGAKEPGHRRGPWLLELDSDEVTKEGAGLHNHTKRTPRPGPANGSVTGGVLAPPPLLQMKVGGAKVADPSSSGGAAAGEGGGGGGRRAGGVAWRPMPRLVPLGLRGNPP